MLSAVLSLLEYSYFRSDLFYLLEVKVPLLECFTVPWGVAVNVRDEIAVSDRLNHIVQISTGMGIT